MSTEPLLRNWTPTPAQLDAYLKREVEMCCYEINKLRSHPLKQTDTLFSARTWQLAVAKLGTPS